LKLNIDRNRVIKALIAKLKSSEFVVAMIPVTVQLSMKKLACFLISLHSAMPRCSSAVTEEALKSNY